jgi:RNA polymerase nonessential primary-like sigma factor
MVAGVPQLDQAAMCRPDAGAHQSSVRNAGRSANADAMRLYLKEIGKSRLLSAAEEKMLARRLRDGDESAWHRMIECNLRLVVKIARRYRFRGLPLLDLIEEGNLGLMHSIRKFDPERGFRFSTYSTWWIRQAIERALMNQSRDVRLPIYVQKDINSCVRAAGELRARRKRVPTTAEIADRLGRSPEDVDRLLTLHDRASVDSLTANVPDDSAAALDSLPDVSSLEPAALLQSEEVQSMVDLWVRELPAKQRDVIDRRFGLHGCSRSTLEQIGQDIGVTRERVRQIQLEALGKLKELLKDQGVSSDAVLD